jgi:hypothetical protein
LGWQGWQRAGGLYSEHIMHGFMSEESTIKSLHLPKSSHKVCIHIIISADSVLGIE